MSTLESLRTLGGVALYIGTVAGSMLAVGGLLRYVVVLPLKRWIELQVSAPILQIRKQVVHLQKWQREHTRDHP